MSAMRCRLFSLMSILAALVLTVRVPAQSADLNEHLRQEYQGKTFLLRGFYSADHLRYDSNGMPDDASSGDWTVDGFLLITGIHLSDDRLVIKGQRMAAAWLDKNEFELRPLERQRGLTKSEVRVEIKADPGMHNPAPEQVDALISKIFLTSQDRLADLVPDYWRPCLRGQKGTDKKCAFASELLAVPGVAASTSEDNTATAIVPAETQTPATTALHVGKGVSPPRVINQHEPEFSDGARAAKFQGVVVLMLVVDREGAPTHIRITKPLGYGLDEKAVAAVSGWRFSPAEKDGMPVNVEIAVEVCFHLY